MFLLISVLVVEYWKALRYRGTAAQSRLIVFEITANTPAIQHVLFEIFFMA